MKRSDQASQVLRAFALPRAQQNERSALTLLALANLAPNTPWRNAKTSLQRTVDIMEFIRTHYKKDYAANSRETFRRQTLHQFTQAHIVVQNPDDPDRPTNSGRNAYQLTDDALAVLRTVGSDSFDAAVTAFISKHGSLQAVYAPKRNLRGVPLRLPNGTPVKLSPGKHNQLQKAVIELWAPRFVPGAVLLYLGDTAKKNFFADETSLARLSIPFNDHDKLPDLILYLPDRRWLFLIEAVTTHGPVSPKRHHEMEAVLKNSVPDRIYVTAFPDMKTFRKYAGDIAWETEAWIADAPDHMIHFNGPKFLGPYHPGLTS